MKNKRIKYIFQVMLLVVIFTMASGVEAAVYFNDDIEGGTVGSKTTYHDATSGAGWEYQHNITVVDGSMSSVPAHSGTKMLRYEFSYPDAGYRAEGRFTLGSHRTGDIYIRYYIYHPDGTEGNEVRYAHAGTKNNKAIRLFGETYESRNKVGAELRGTDLPNVERIYFNARVGDYASGHESRCDANVGPAYKDGTMLPNYTWTESDLGRWISYEWHFRSDDGSGNGVMEFWVDGTLVSSTHNISMVGAPCDPGYFINGYLLGAANEHYAANTNVYIDDVVFSDTYIGPATPSPDVQAPTLVEVTAVATPTSDSTPNYTFSSNEQGNITYSGDCSSATKSAISGNNTITLGTLADGTYSNCKITVTDSSSNISDPLSITSFTINRSIASSTKADVDLSGSIDIIDALLTFRNSLELDMSGTTWKASATGDANCDGVSNSVDVRLILRDSLDLDMSGTGWCAN